VKRVTLIARAGVGQGVDRGGPEVLARVGDGGGHVVAADELHELLQAEVYFQR